MGAAACSVSALAVSVSPPAAVTLCLSRCPPDHRPDLFRNARWDPRSIQSYSGSRNTGSARPLDRYPPE